MASDTRRARSHQPSIERLTIDGRPYWHHTFPFEPSWWPDSRHASRRQRLTAEFELGGIETLCTDLRQMIEDPLRFASQTDLAARQDECAGLARRCLSLSWITTVARDHLRQHQAEMDQAECAIRGHEVRAAECLANNAWNVLLDLPKPLAIQAIREAVARPDELFEADSLE